MSINPGFVGLRDLRGSSEADLVVQVQAQRWSWVFTYPDGVRSTTELALPVDERVRFDVTATDIVHSFWIPAFRTKIDAVPGRTTQLYVTPERTGDADRDFNVRVQCAELCGLGHTVMAAPVRVLERAEFDAWLAAQKQGA
ncbi:MAG: cytochrome c oxidase subunit II [Acidimicrobiales bacterium]